MAWVNRDPLCFFSADMLLHSEKFVWIIQIIKNWVIV